MNDEDFSSNTADLSSSIEVTKKTLTSESLEDFDSRKTVVEKIISDMISAEKYTVNINLQDVDVESEKLERFIIELVPRLKEIRGSVVVSNNSILSDEFLTSYNI